MSSIEIATTAGTLAVAPDQIWWTPAQQAVLQSTGIDGDVTEPELRAFLHEAQRTGLDPFTRQIYLIGRFDRRAGRKIFRSQTGIDGYRVIAHRAAARSGEALSYDDALWCGEDGVWRDVWLSRTPPAAAKVTVYRGSAKFSAVATWAEYAPTDRDGKPMGLWPTKGAVMVAKCAEALALRKAFPHDLSGVYTAEEMQQADARETGGAQRSRPARPVEDEWSTPAPNAKPVEAQRDYLAEARQVPDAEAVRGIWREASGAGAPAEYLAQIAAIGAELATAAAPAPEAPAAPVEPGAPAPDAETAAARAEVFDAARDARLPADEVRREFENTYGHPLDEAPVAELREMRDLLLGQVTA